MWLRNGLSRVSKFVLMAFAALGIFWACHLTQEDGQTYLSITVDTSFTKYDRLMIVVKDDATGAQDTVFNKQLAAVGDLSKVPVENYQGQKVSITFTGFKDGQVVYQEVRQYDGQNPGITSVQVIVSAETVVSTRVSPRSLTLQKGGPAKEISAEVMPVKASQAVLWNSTNINAATVQPKAGDVARALVSPVDVGETFIVVASQKDMTKTDTVTVTVVENGVVESSNANLSALSISAGALDNPAFSPQARVSGATVANSVTAISVTATVEDAAASLIINGSAAASGVASPSIPLNVGVDSIFVLVTAEDGTVKTYALAITRAASSASNNLLYALTVSSGPLNNPVFNSNNRVSGAIVANSVDSVTVTATLADTSARLTINGTATPGGTASGRIPLKVGVDSIFVIVTAKDGTQRTYAVAMTRAAVNAHSNADLSALTVSAGPLNNPAFSPSVRVSGAAVANGVASTTVTATVADTTARIIINGKPVPSGAPSEAIPLAVGVDSIFVIVTAQDASQKTYVIALTRAPGLSANAKLSALVVSAGILNAPAFDPNSRVSGALVANSVSSTTVTATAADTAARLTIDGTATASGAASAAIPLAVGVDSILIVVTAQDGTKNTYAIGITRSAPEVIDTIAPAMPKIFGTSPTSVLPRWTWSTGGNGGNGVFRSRLADANFPANAPQSTDTVFALTTAASGTTYTLFVQERDAAGNWSAAASLPIKYDLTKPTVTIAVPQASGVFITAADTVTVSGSSTGPNGIAKIEYALDAGARAAATVGANGNWVLSALEIANARTTTITVTATDNLGNAGQAELKVLRDSDPPTPPTVLVKPVSPTNVAPSSWSWSTGSDGAAGSGLSGKYRWKLNSGIWTETLTASATAVTLVEGSNTFSVAEQDKAGNWSEPLIGTVVLDSKVPGAVTFVGTDGTLTADDTPTWTWAPSVTNGGTGQYLLKLDAGAEFDGGAATSYTPLTPLADNATHTLTVKEKDQVAGVAGTAKSFSYKIKVNPPAAPIVKSAVASLPNNGVTNNPGFTIATGGGGNGKFRVKVNTEAAYRVNGVAQAAFSLALSDADGTYTVFVSEQDDLGRYGLEGSFTIKLDRTAPLLANAAIEGKSFQLRDGFITNVPSLLITYTSDAAPKSFTCVLTDNASTLCKDAVQTDAAGNTATFQTNVWRKSKVIFFSPTGTGDGSSWEEADNDLQAHIGLSDVNGKELWLATGNYAANNVSLDLNRKLVTVLGGFSFSARPINSSNRTKTTTTLGGIHANAMDACIFDGITFTESVEPSAMGTATKHGQFIDCTFKTNLHISTNSFIDFKNCSMINVNNGEVPIYLTSGATIVWDGGQITGNPPPFFESFSITITEDCSATFKNMTIANNIGTLHPYQAYTAGHLVIETSVLTFQCLDDLSIYTGASGTCKGIEIVP
jgi:hypothetical protein